MGRTLIVGDVHGCAHELREMLARVGFATGDRLVLVGDIVARGPDTPGVFDIVRQTGALVVRGNHEDRILQFRPEEDHPLAWGARATPLPSKVARKRDKAARADKPLGRIHADVVAKMRPVDWTLLEAAPLFLDLPEHGVRVVHAGVVPGVPLDHQRRSTMLTIRTLGSRGEALEKGGSVLWGTRYQGPPHIVFGHYARPLPQLHAWATGLDTGCVYGGTLTAMLLQEGEQVPRDVEARKKMLMTVPAAREYYASRGK